VESQAISRAIRLGQENEVRVTSYITKDTVEEVSFSVVFVYQALVVTNCG
jgi:SNF2 family DNA or RNA helicase